MIQKLAIALLLALFAATSAGCGKKGSPTLAPGEKSDRYPKPYPAGAPTGGTSVYKQKP